MPCSHAGFRNPKIENYVKALEDCGVRVGWDEQIWRDLRAWREVRNKFVHELEMPQRTRDLSSSAARKVFWLVDAAISKLDYAMAVLEPFTKHASR